MSTVVKKFVNDNGEEMTPEELKAARKKAVQEALAADAAMDALLEDFNDKMEAAKLVRSEAIKVLVEDTGVEKFKHPDGYVLTPSRKEKTASGVPGIYFLRGKPKVEKKISGEVFDLDE